jgi:PBP1b-binding outer membrane lipoprotein LpoB
MLVLTYGCASVENSAGRRTVDIDPGTRGPVAGIGIEGHDIVSMSDRMMREMLSIPAFAAAGPPPQVLIDSSEFRNNGPQRLDKDIITDRLRVALNAAGRGRLVFVSRQHTETVMQERELKRIGMVDSGTLAPRAAMAGVDYKLVGNITAITSSSNQTGLVQRMNQITFELIDLERGTIVWGNTYTLARAAADDVVYR